MRGLRSEAVLVWLLFTTPCFNAAVNDSGEPYCHEGPSPLTDLKEVRVYFWPQTGGMATRIKTQSMVGKQCRPESVSVSISVGGLFWVTHADTAGNESCASNTVRKALGPITGVDPVDVHPQALRFYDVHGRRVETPRASGIYWVVNPNRKEERPRKMVFIK